MSEFDAFESNPATDAADPAADFLAQEEAEMAKIENSDPFAAFESAENNTNATEIKDPFEMEELATETEVLDIKDTADEEKTNDDVYSSIGHADVLTKEPEQITRWREEQRTRLSTKDAEEDAKKKEMMETAKKELDDWYKNREEQLAKTIANNKINDKATVDELAALREKAESEAEWDRMSKLCDFNPKANKNSKDVSRMRSILLQLKQTPLVR